MSQALPSHITDTVSAASRCDQLHDVMGVVVDFLPPKPASLPDWTLTFTIVDQAWKFNSSGEGFKIRCFAPPDRLPTINSIGDVVLLRSIKTKNWRGSNIGLSNKSTSWVVFPQASIPEPSSNNGGELKFEKLGSSPAPTRAHFEYAVALCSLQDRPTPGVGAAGSVPVASDAIVAQPVSAPSSRPEQKFSLIKDLNPSEARLYFVDLLCQVRKVWENDFRLQLYVTDYTSNKDLFNYEFERTESVDGDPLGYSRPKTQWPGPFGQRTLQITLWDAHAAYANRELKVDDYVLLKNVQVVQGEAGGILEGKLRGNRFQPDQVNVIKLHRDHARVDDRMRELLIRKRRYESKENAEKKKLREEMGGMAKEEGTTGGGKKKKNKKRQKTAAPVATGGIVQPLQAKRYEANANVHCHKVDVPLKLVRDILDRQSLKTTTPSGVEYYLPFHNHCYHAKVQAVDYFPATIEDFAVPVRESDLAALSDQSSVSSVNSESVTSDFDGRWEWRFCLVVEDPGPPLPGTRTKEQMQLIVAGHDGDFLLKMDAVDLRQDPEALEKLRYKLSLLWGNLEERRSQLRRAGRDDNNGAGGLAPEAVPLSNRPFECCIKEYGIPIPKDDDEDGEAGDEDVDVDMVDDGQEDRADPTRTGPELGFERMFRVFGTTIMD